MLALICLWASCVRCGVGLLGGLGVEVFFCGVDEVGEFFRADEPAASDVDGGESAAVHFSLHGGGGWRVAECREDEFPCLLHGEWFLWCGRSCFFHGGGAGPPVALSCAVRLACAALFEGLIVALAVAFVSSGRAACFRRGGA